MSSRRTLCTSCAVRPASHSTPRVKRSLTQSGGVNSACSAPSGLDTRGASEFACWRKMLFGSTSAKITVSGV